MGAGILNAANSSRYWFKSQNKLELTTLPGKKSMTSSIRSMKTETIVFQGKNDVYLENSSAS